eukprot:358486-Chlamydomonas_euryale.AAC.24
MRVSCAGNAVSVSDACREAVYQYKIYRSININLNVPLGMCSTAARGICVGAHCTKLPAAAAFKGHTPCKPVITCALLHAQICRRCRSSPELGCHQCVLAPALSTLHPGFCTIHGGSRPHDGGSRPRDGGTRPTSVCPGIGACSGAAAWSCAHWHACVPTVSGITGTPTTPTTITPTSAAD